MHRNHTLYSLGCPDIEDQEYIFTKCGQLKSISQSQPALHRNCCSSASIRATKSFFLIKCTSLKSILFLNRWTWSSSLGFVMLFECQYSSFPPLQGLFDTLNHLISVKWGNKKNSLCTTLESTSSLGKVWLINSLCDTYGSIWQGRVFLPNNFNKKQNKKLYALILLTWKLLWYKPKPR